jgi:hypothetical protein
MLMTRVITCTQFKRDYVDVIDIRDTAQRVRWVEVWVKKVRRGGAREEICIAKRRPNQSPPLGSPSWT